MQNAVGQRAAGGYTAGRVHWLGQRSRPTDVALPCVLGCGQGDKPSKSLETALEGEVAEGDVVVALLTVYVGGKGIIASRRRELCLGSRHPGSRVSPLPLYTLPPSRGMSLSDKPFLQDGPSCRCPQLVNHREEADGPLGQGHICSAAGPQ